MSETSTPAVSSLSARVRERMEKQQSEIEETTKHALGKLEARLKHIVNAAANEFPIPMRGNEIEDYCVGDDKIYMFPIPMRGNESARPPGSRSCGLGVIVIKKATLKLITPHGDREQEISDVHGPRGSTYEAHYPSWGSGTCAISPWVAELMALWISLPLMGIGNKPSRIRSTMDMRDMLITPHGDREPTNSKCGKSINRSHYPSWGSGTIRDLINGNMSNVLITPHGDRELAHRRG